MIPHRISHFSNRINKITDTGNPKTNLISVVATLFIAFLLTLTYGRIFAQSASNQAGYANGGQYLRTRKDQAFIHPGLLQNKADLELTKKRILAGEQPWKDAFEKVKTSIALDFNPRPVTHVIRGTNGRPAIGGSELTASARQAYACALVWYMTADKKYAQKAIEILNAWSSRLWDFEGNDAKLLAAWTGHELANAAEILRYSNAGWQQKDIDVFKQLLLTVYYPLIKNFFPEANGNWDAAIMNTLLCIGVFCDNQEIFNSAVEHFLYGKGNGGITKYIYPNGQCEESARDQGHVQLGLDELAGTCQVAWTQGIDLYGAADNRLALGVEYTAKYMAGVDVPAYGLISTDARGRYRNVYESVYQHYLSVKGLQMPYTKIAIDSTRSKGGLDLLSAVKLPVINKNKLGKQVLIPLENNYGAMNSAITAAAANAILVAPGESIQAALDKSQQSHGWVILTKGVHILPEPLQLRSGVTLSGQGKESVLFLDPKLLPDRGFAAIFGRDSLQDVMLCDFVVEGATTIETTKDPNQDRRRRASQMAQTRAGILLMANDEGQIENIKFRNLTVRHCTHNGVALKGVSHFEIIDCDFSDNGGSVAPGWGTLHNLLLFKVSSGQIRHNRFDDSPWGSGIDLSFGKNLFISKNEVARNYGNGVGVFESEAVVIEDNFIESNDTNGISSNRLYKGNKQLTASKNTLQYNAVNGNVPKIWGKDILQNIR